jgi:hypothetical protein
MMWDKEKSVNAAINRLPSEWEYKTRGLVVRGNCSVHGNDVDCFVIAAHDVECCECFTPARETA